MQRAGRSFIAQWSCNSIGIVWALHVRGGQYKMIDSCTDALKQTNIL